MSALAKELRGYALAHYNDGGWDVIIECWSDEEIDKVLTEEKAETLDDAIKAFEPLVEVWKEREAEAESYREPVDDFDPHLDEYGGGYGGYDNYLED